MKTLTMHPIEADGMQAVVPIGIVRGRRKGPTLSVIGGVHGTEYAAHEAVHEFWHRLDPDEIAGEVRVVLLADSIAAIEHAPFRNPTDGKNLNRVWPGDAAGTITERIARHLTDTVVSGSTAVVDVHCGEWGQTIRMWAFTHRSGNKALDEKSVALALSTGFPFIEVTDADGDVLGKGTTSGEAVRAGIPALTLEAGGEGTADADSVHALNYALENALRHLGAKSEGSPLLWSGTPTVLARTEHLFASSTGRLVTHVPAGGVIDAGEPVASVLDFDDRPIESIESPVTGPVLFSTRTRWVKAGTFVAKVGSLEP